MIGLIFFSFIFAFAGVSVAIISLDFFDHFNDPGRKKSERLSFLAIGIVTMVAGLFIIAHTVICFFAALPLV